MTPIWPFVSILLASGAWAPLAYAQSGGAAPASGGASAAPKAAAAEEEDTGPVRSALPQTGTTPVKKADGTGGVEVPQGTTPAASPFTLPPAAKPGEQNLRSPFGVQRTGASSLFGTRQNTDGTIPSDTGTTGADGGGTKPIEAPATFSAPGFYGGGGVSLTTGQGRLAKPKERWTMSAGMGFDDNTQQTPTDGGGTDDVVFRQTVPGQREISRFETAQVPTGKFTNNNGVFVPIFRTATRKVVLQPFVAEREIVQRFPGIPDQARQASVISSLDVSYQAQWAKGRKAFTLDTKAGVDYYWSRSKDPLEYDASLAMQYIRRLSSRLQLSTALSASHQTQPDYSRVNAAANSNIGAQSIVSSKTDLSYRWSRRVSTVTSLTMEGRLQDGVGAGSYYSYGLGQEFRYLSSPRLTYVGDVRYTIVDYTEGDSSSSTISLLAGFDWQLSRRFQMTTRLGESIRTFQPEGKTSGSPYGELYLNYQPDRKDVFSFSSRYGFEESAANTEQLVFRSSLSYQRLFSPKFSGTASVSKLSYETKTPGGTSAQDILDGSLGLRYVISRKFKLGASYNYTNSTTELGTSDYYKNRIFFTGDYEF